MTSRQNRVILAALVGGFVLLWYLKPFPWLGAATGSLAGLFTFYVLGTGRMERLRRPFFIILFVFISGTLITNILLWGPTSFMQSVSGWNPGYYFPGSTALGTLPYPTPIVLPAIFWRGAEFLAEAGVWQTAVPTTLGAFLLFMIPYVLIFAVFGRAFCGWLCPLGGLPEAMAAGNKERWQLNFLQEKTVTPGGVSYTSLKGWVNIVRYALLLVVIVLSLLLGFAVVHIFYPVLWLKSITAFWVVAAILLVSAVVLPFMTKRRWWCFICPVGAVLSPLQKISPFRLKIDQEKCVKCMDCVHACRMYALTPQGVEAGKCESGYCVRCGRCIDACSEEAIDLSWVGSRKKARGPFTALVVATAFALYIWYLVLLVSFSSRINDFRWFS